MSNSRIHLAHIDGLRALCALWVMLFHASLPLFVDLSKPLQVVCGWMSYGYLAVPVFIVISGFCLAIPLVRGNGSLRGTALTFWKKRARRILPPYYAAMMICIVMRHGIHMRDVVTHALLIQNIWPDTYFSVNPSFWSIAVECQIYAFFPLLVLGYKRLGVVLTSALASATGLGVYLMILPTHQWGLTSHFIALFSLGVLAAYISLSDAEHFRAAREQLNWSKITGILALLLLLCCLRWGNPPFKMVDNIPTRSTLFPGLLYAGLAGLTSACLLIRTTLSPSALSSRVLSWKPFVSIGVFSYSLYLLHQPFVNFVDRFAGRRHLGEGRTLLLQVLVAAPVIIGASYLFHCLFERPFMSSPAPKTERQAEQAALASPAP